MHLAAYLECARIRYSLGMTLGRRAMKLCALIRDLPGIALKGDGEVRVTGVTCDSRRVKPGMLFVAVPGTKMDGRAFVAEALQAGAAAVALEPAAACPEPCPIGLWFGAAHPGVPHLIVPDARAATADLAAAFHGHPTRRLRVIGVTGTSGKSTTTYLIKSICDAAGRRAGLLGTIKYELGGRELPSNNTTPGADELQGYFADMVAAGLHAGVMEVSSHALVQGRVRGVEFAAAVFSNLTQDHLDYHGTMDEYREAKGILFRDLAPGAAAVLNADDPASDRYAALTKGRVAWYGLNDPRAAYTAEVISSDFHGSSILVKTPDGPFHLETRMVGTHNVYNLLAATAACHATGIPLEDIQRGLETTAVVPGRLEAVDCGQDFAVFVDYAHKPDAMENVLHCLRPLVRGRLITVFGCGGDRDRGKRPLMGKIASERSDFVILTSDNPRSERPGAILREIEKGIADKAKYRVCEDREEGIRRALSMAEKGDVVLIAGKGHEAYQIFKDTVKPFDDRQVAREILTQMHGYVTRQDSLGAA